MKDQNSFSELTKEAHELRELAESCGEPTLVFEQQAANIRAALLKMLVTTVDNKKLNKLISNFRSKLEAAGFSFDVQSFMGALVGCIASAQEDSSSSLVDTFGSQFSEALAVIGSNADFQWALHDSSEDIEGNTRSLLHAATAVENYDATKMPYASQSDIDGYFYRSYFHGIKCQVLCSLWSAVKRQEGRFKKQHKEMGALAHTFTNVFFSFLHATSEHACCSRSLRTCIRTHLISFTDDESKKFMGWNRQFDVENVELRVTTADIDRANTEGQWNFDKCKTPKYCKDL